MSFFDALPPPPLEPPPVQRPEWMGPPEGWLGGFVPTRITLVRSAERVITIGPATAYPNGVVLVMTHTMRRPVNGHQMGPLGLPGWGPGAARYGVAFADGSKWQTGNEHPLAHGIETPARGPVLLPRGGGGGGNEWRQELWLWPLPPPGPVTFAFAWPDEGIEETTVTVDGQVFRDAAAQAEQLWEPLSPEEHRAIMEEHRRGGFGPPPGTGFTSMTLSASRAEPDDED